MSFGATREIVTFLFGNYSHLIGTHWFNIQAEEDESELDRGVLWEESYKSKERKAIWNPRLVIFDLKNNCSSWTTHSEESSKSEVNAQWTGEVERLEQEAEEPPGPTNSTSRAPFMRWKLGSPSDSVFPVSHFDYNLATNVLSNYGQGFRIYSDRQEEITNGIRRYAEKCDYLQGFHLLVDQNDGFGGLAAGALEHLNDDYEKKVKVCYGTGRMDGEENHTALRTRVANTVLFWNAANTFSSNFTPLSLDEELSKPNGQGRKFPRLEVDNESEILAAALDTLTSPYRARGTEKISLQEIVGLLTAYGHKMSAVGSAIPFPIRDNLFETLATDGFSSLHSLTPGVSLDFENTIGNYFTLRGVTSDRVLGRLPELKRRQLLEKGISNVESCVEVYSRESCPKSVNVVKSVVTPLRVSPHFPTLFDQKTHETPSKPIPRHQGGAGGIRELVTMGTAHNSLLVGNLLERMIDEADVSSRLNNFFVQSELEPDNYSATINDLRSLRDAY